jgi:hypothetical protein
VKRELARPLEMEFDGWDATENRVDAQQLGRSIQGAGRLYRTAYHFYFTGELAARQRPHIRVLAGPPEQGTLSYLLWVMIAHGQLAVYPELLAEFADMCVPELVKGAIAKRAGQKRIADQALEKVHDIAKDNAELQKRFIDYAVKVEEGHQRREEGRQRIEERLLATIEKATDDLGQRNSGAITALADPIGKSVRQLTHAKDRSAEYVIDEPAAAVIRAHGGIEVQDTKIMRVRLGAVDVISRTCKILSDDYSKPIKGKITDPVIEVTNNIYTSALHQGTEIEVTGKPAMKNGDLFLFYVSDARVIS